MSTCADIRSFIGSKTSVVQASNVGFTSEVSDYLVVHMGPGKVEREEEEEAVTEGHGPPQACLHHRCVLQANCLTPEEAVDFVKSKRPHIWLREKQLKSISTFFHSLRDSSSSSSSSV